MTFLVKPIGSSCPCSHTAPSDADSEATYIISAVLADRSARSLAFGLDNELATPFWSAVKTGTLRCPRPAARISNWARRGRGI
jgi:hypothetical protein